MQNIQQTITTKIRDALEPEHLEVINESGKHNVPPDSESHFKVTVVSGKFETCTLIERHRTINGLLADELAHKIHALALHTLTPEEWKKRNGQVTATPNCRGGGKQVKFHK